MRPLILDTSSASSVPELRRVVYIEFAADDLLGGWKSNERITP